MSKYKVGDKIVMEITKIFSDNFGTKDCIVKGFTRCDENCLNEHSEPLSTYTLPLEDKIHKQAEEITRLLAENERLKAENEKMSIKIDAYELCGNQHEVEYNQAFNQGAETAWELARKITVVPKDGGYGGSKLIEIFNTALNNEIFNLTYPEAAAKVAEWEKAKEEIKVGDVLEDIADNNVKCVVVKPYSSNMAYLVFSDGSAGLNELDNLRKTGKHTDINSFLKQIKEAE